MTSPTLVNFDGKRMVTLQCDALHYGLRATLMEDGQLVAYASLSVTSAERNYAQIEKELLAVVFGMEKFYRYTYGRFMQVKIDHKPLQSIVRKPLVEDPKRLQRMLLLTQCYIFGLGYKKGSEMFLADTLSRLKQYGQTPDPDQSEFQRDI